LYNVQRVLEALDISYTERGDNAQALCPMHEQLTGTVDHNPSWYIHLETGQHICFSCGYKGGILSLVCDVKELHTQLWDKVEYDYSAARLWIADVAEVTIEELKEKLAKLPEYISPPPRPVAMSEARLAVFVPPTESALLSRNLTAESADHYGVLWNQNTATWILPLRDPDTKKLMGWQEKGTVDRKFNNRPMGLQKSKTLFGAEVQQEDIAIVVESPLDCLRIRSAGFEGAVATCGAIISEAQVKLLSRSEKVVAAFDNPNLDSAGKKASEQLRTLARKYGLNLFFFNYGDARKKDPGDMTDEEIRWGITHAKSAILGESAYVLRNTETVSS
jgi:hypothetical protein